MVAAFGTWGGWPFLTAVGTVGAVVVAVGLQWWIAHKEDASRPKLTLHFDEHWRVDETNLLTGTLVPYLRLAVTNAEGRKTADDVEILIVGVEEYAISPIGSSGRSIWLANPALGWTNSVDPSPRMTIPPGTTRYVDLGRWMQLEGRGALLSLVLCTVPEPGSNRHVLDPGGWRIRLAVTARNADATFWEAEVSYGQTTSTGVASLIDAAAMIKQLASARG